MQLMCKHEFAGGNTQQFSIQKFARVQYFDPYQAWESILSGSHYSLITGHLPITQAQISCKYWLITCLKGNSNSFKNDEYRLSNVGAIT